MDQVLAPFRAEAQRLFHLLAAIVHGLPHSVSGFRWMLANLECKLKRWFVFEAHARALAILKEEETRGRNYSQSGFKRDRSKTGKPIPRIDPAKRRLPFVVMMSFASRERSGEPPESGWSRRHHLSWRQRAIYGFSVRIMTLLQVLKDPDHTLARTTKQWLDQMHYEQDRARYEAAARAKAEDQREVAAGKPGDAKAGAPPKAAIKSGAASNDTMTAAEAPQANNSTYIYVPNDLSTDQAPDARWAFYALLGLPEPET